MIMGATGSRFEMRQDINRQFSRSLRMLSVTHDSSHNLFENKKICPQTLAQNLREANAHHLSRAKQPCESPLVSCKPATGRRREEESEGGKEKETI